jgi:hypothetical protein
VSGTNEQKHLPEQAKQHEIFVVNIHSEVKITLSGSTNISAQLNDGYCVSIQHHTKLCRMINCVKFCGTNT